MAIAFESVPAGSLIVLPEDKIGPYVDRLMVIPKSVRAVAFSLKTGAYLGGLSKTYGIPENNVPLLSFLVLQILIGEKTFPQLSAMLSTDLKLPNDKAQKMAQEIERDLIVPIAGDLNRYLAEKNKKKGSMSEKMRSSEVQTADQVRSTKKAAPPTSAPSRRQSRPAANPQNILDLNKNRPGPKPPRIPR